MRRIDCSYTVTEAQLREYAQVPEIERLRWLEDLARFTRMFQEAPAIDQTGLAAPASHSPLHR